MKDDKNSPIKAFLILLLVLILFAALVIGLPFACGAGACDNCIDSCSGKKATMKDISFDYDIEITDLRVRIYVTPKVDIDDLSLKISFYDSNHDNIKTMIKDLGNVKEGEKEDFTISLTDFSVADLLELYSVECEIDSGRVVS